MDGYLRAAQSGSGIDQPRESIFKLRTKCDINLHVKFIRMIREKKSFATVIEILPDGHKSLGLLAKRRWDNSRQPLLLNIPGQLYLIPDSFDQRPRSDLFAPTIQLTDWV